jgi:phosphoribosylanthranilate isomerase
MIIKVCGMREAENIRQVEQLGADWMGFIFYPRSPRYVDARPAYLPLRQKRVGVFVNADEEFILNRVKVFHLDLVQLHGNETPTFTVRIRNHSNCPVIKAFGISDDSDFNIIHSYEGAADYFLFDTSCTTAGGSGRTFDHHLLAKYEGTTPFLLSGGLGPDDADEINDYAHPAFAGIDLNSRFELRPALKSVEQLQAFFSKLKRNNIQKPRT